MFIPEIPINLGTQKDQFEINFTRIGINSQWHDFLIRFHFWLQKEMIPKGTIPRTQFPGKLKNLFLKLDNLIYLALD